MTGAATENTGRRLVLTADDFGYDRDSDALITQLLAEGAVTATTVIAPSLALGADAPRLVERTDACGLHLTLSSDAGREPWGSLGGDEAACLVESGGAFPDDPSVAEARATPDAVGAELAAQYATLLDVGLAPNRVDSHAGTIYGLHGNPLMGPVLAFCAAHGLGLRLPRGLELYLGPSVPPALVHLHAQAVGAATQLGVSLPAQMASDQVPAKDVTEYEPLRDRYIAFLRRLPAGTSEIFLHPGAESQWARERFGRSWDKRVFEARLLRDPVWRDVLEVEGIELVTSW